jgi:hypothetical protein
MFHEHALTHCQGMFMKINWFDSMPIDTSQMLVYSSIHQHYLSSTLAFMDITYKFVYYTSFHEHTLICKTLVNPKGRGILACSEEQPREGAVTKVLPLTMALAAIGCKSHCF